MLHEGQKDKSAIYFLICKVLIYVENTSEKLN